MMVSTNPASSLSLADTNNLDDAIVPFNVLETRNRDLFAAMAWIFHTNPVEALRGTLREWIQEEDVFFAPSAECGIAQILSLLPQKEVVMPAWICHGVKTAIEVAGKRIIYVDLAKGRINATSTEYAELARPGRILLIAHLFGVPTDVQAICDLARSQDCVTIEDAVPAIGGRQDGRLLGSFADFGVFSFEQSKRMPAFRGGFIVANNGQLIERNKLETFRVTKTSSVMPLLSMTKAFTKNLATNPWVYRTLTATLLQWWPLVSRALSAAKGHKAAPASTTTVNDVHEVKTASSTPVPHTPLYTREIHPYQAELAMRMINRIDRIGDKIARLASVYNEVLRDSPIATFLPPGCDTSGLMRFPVAFPGKERPRILERAAKQRIPLKVLWGEEVGLEGLPNSLWVARNLVLLPLYTALSERSAARIAQAIVEIDRNTPPGWG
jgi:dTDP-4-amino-4,6-dideoxygalactose transaminase